VDAGVAGVAPIDGEPFARGVIVSVDTAR